MKTSEFIEKFNGVLNNLKAIRLDGGVSLDGDNGREYVIEDYEMIPILGVYSLDIDQLSLITEYMATPIEKREPERKWVVPIPGLTINGCRAYLKSDCTDHWCTWGDDGSGKIAFTERELKEAPSWVQRDWWQNTDEVTTAEVER